MPVIIDGTTGITTPGVTDTGNLSVTGTTTLTTVLPVGSGGTGLTTVGTNGQVLQSNGTSLQWATPSAGTQIGLVRAISINCILC